MLFQFLSLSPGAPYSLRSTEDVMSAWLFSVSTTDISLLFGGRLDDGAGLGAAAVVVGRVEQVRR